MTNLRVGRDRGNGSGKNFDHAVDLIAVDTPGDRVRDRYFYIVKTRLGEKHFLRSTLTNPFTEKEHLEGMLENIKATARDLRTVAL